VGLASVRPGARAIGWQAADWIASGAAKAGARAEVPPEGITERKSADAFAVGDERVRRALKGLESGFRETVDFAALARDAGMSPRNMVLLFRRHLGVTPGQWLDRLRLQEAQRLLGGTSLSQEEVATRSGFSNAVTFWRMFKRETGQSPANGASHAAADAISPIPFITPLPRTTRCSLRIF
jgi:transcriptional regulator GlxA family with amidase domain